jgi:hypothetical protein
MAIPATMIATTMPVTQANALTLRTVLTDRCWRLRGTMKVMRTGRLVALVTVALIATACSAGQYVPPTTQLGFPPTTSVPPIPAVVTSATPSGWVPVAYGNVEVSVPPTFSVLYPGWNDCGATSFPDVLELGLPTLSRVGCGAAPPRLPATTVQIRYGHSTFQLEAMPSTVINALSADPLVDHITRKVVGYYVPALGTEVIGSGPLAGTILHTLTRSPRAVVLAPGSAPSVPSGWHTVNFDGLAFEAPTSWLVTPTALSGDDVGRLCSNWGVVLTNTEIALSADQESANGSANCQPIPPWSKYQQPLNGVEVDGGNLVKFPVTLAFSKQCRYLHSLTVCPATTPDYSILVLKVTVPGRATPVLVSIGLAGNGMVARTILYSLRAA